MDSTAPLSDHDTLSERVRSRFSALGARCGGAPGRHVVRSGAQLADEAVDLVEPPFVIHVEAPGDSVRTSIEGLTPDDLDRPVAAHAKTVGGALAVLFGEMTAHNRFINRDLDIIEGSRPKGALTLIDERITPNQRSPRG